MKLSEAIRKGATLRPQCTGRPFKWDLDTRVMGSCVIGAAIEAMGFQVGDNSYALGNLDAIELLKGYGLIPLGKTLPPQNLPLLKRNGLDPHTLYDLDLILYVLNDEYHYSREAIAEWLESKDL